tara:strand:- start:1341 stop:3776 length:2436 start_codon:yes stop_codon:yes gene_type:complete
MIENNLLKSNFLGKDGFRWWIGQIPPRETWALQWSKRPQAWGNRVRVRIMGYHPQNTTELADDDLPWAQVIIPATAGSGKAGKVKPIRIAQGDIVVGFFLDGDDAQLPVIFGVIGNSEYVVNKTPPSPFVPFSGFVPEVQPEGKRFTSEKGAEVGTQSQLAQPSPRQIDKNQAEQIKASTGKDVKTTSDVVGTCVPLAGTSASDEIKAEVKNGVADFKGKTGIQKAAIKNKLAKKITGASNEIAGDLVKKGAVDAAKQANTGVIKLGNDVFNKTLAATKSTSVAKKAMVAAQSAMIPSVSAFQSKIPCVIEGIADTMLPDVTDLLTSFLDNVVSFTPCIGDQFVGALFNKITDGIGGALAPELGGMSKIMGGFDMVNNLRGKAEGLLGIQEAIKCVKPGTAQAGTNIYCLGKGPMNMPGVAGETIMEIANAAQALQEAAGAPGGIVGGLLGQFDFLNPGVSTEGFSSALGECYTGPPLDCKGVQVNIFGSDGQGSIAEPIIGAIVPDSLVQQTGSLIGIKLTNPGEGYTVPPLVEITDNCNRGYGANARAIIDYDPQSPTYQQVIDIYVVTPGENYPVIEDTVSEYTVDHVLVVSPGENYKEEDVITDNSGNVYVKFLDEQGRILNVIAPNPITQNVNSVKDIPELSIETDTGFGAIIKPQLAPRPQYQGEVKQVIDCITPRDGIVGYVNGEPYYGPFHVHPTRGVKMVGVAHTTSAHAIIYDTPAESRGKNAVIGGASSQFQTIAADGTVTYTPSETPTTTNTAPMTDNTSGDGSVTYQDTTPSPPSTSSGSSDSGGSSTPPSSGGGYGY